MSFSMGNEQLATANAKWRRAGLLVVQSSLLVLSCLPLAACGGEGNHAPAAPKETSLEGDRAERQPIDSAPAIDLSKAPTETHRRLAQLFSVPSLIRESLAYGGWDGQNADISMQDPARAAMPVVSADYLSTGYKIMTGTDDNKTATQDYPQSCKLVVIQAPDSVASGVIVANIYRKLEGVGFEQRDPIELVMGKDKLHMERFVRIDTEGDHDTVRIGYVAAFGDIVAYALEKEEPPKVTGPGDTQIQRVTDNRGSRLGAQLITMVHHLRGE
ncbi:MAG: hypothetical protein IT464_16665 [Planctomycetes bacterium]|nr:hypothetical protein [Planctomycetota bacterium]